MTDPTVVFEVAIWNEDGPEHRAVFTDRALAEAYRARLRGSDLEEIPIQSAAPELVTVHQYETWVLPDSVSMLPKPPYLKHWPQERWSHEMWPEPERWSNPGSHHHETRLTTEPNVVVLQTWGYGERATRDEHLDEAQRIRQRLVAEAAVRAVAEGHST